MQQMKTSSVTCATLSFACKTANHPVEHVQVSQKVIPYPHLSVRTRELRFALLLQWPHHDRPLLSSIQGVYYRLSLSDFQILYCFLPDVVQ